MAAAGPACRIVLLTLGTPFAWISTPFSSGQPEQTGWAGAGLTTSSAKASSLGPPLPHVSHLYLIPLALTVAALLVCRGV